MDFSYSRVVDHEMYETDGLDIKIPLRMHKDSKLEVEAAFKVHGDWSRSVHPLTRYHGELGPRYHFVSVTIPECLPERLHIIAYANEFAFLYDDEMEKLEKEDCTQLLETFRETSTSKSKRRAGPEKAIQASIVKEMMAIDPLRAKVTMDSWTTFVHSANRERSRNLGTLEEYVPARVIDCGELIWFGFITFAMALTIRDEEYNLCNDLARPGYAAIGLTNDLYSWKKEEAEARRAGQKCVFNAIWVIMHERSVTEAEAMNVCRAEIRNWISIFEENIEKARSNPGLSKDVRIYLEALLYSYMGNLAWSIECPRYKEL